jgi:DNA-binding CsgD family transcriptional regulator/tetratricopeptide (TPR) repeat protein
MELLEREAPLDCLAAGLASVRAGAGRVALVSGGAGLGKTSLVRAFLDGLDRSDRSDRFNRGVPALVGACDDLSTPRPLGPVHDIARGCRPALAEALARGDVPAVYTALLDELGGEGPTVVVVEDVHWADEATLDALTFLARRADRLPVLLVLTYREDEAASTVSLQRVLGGLHAPVAVRIELRPLSAQAVARLAGEPGRGLRVYASTGGNPFYVTELLAAEDEGVPASVSHAVLARLAKLPEPTRALLELLAVVPARTEVSLLDVLCPGWVEDALPAEARGMLTVHEDAVAFRHELARRAVEESLPALGARGRHARVLAALQTLGADPARLVHHAERAGDDETLAQVAPEAARSAATSSAHREAAAHYRRALRLAHRYPAATQATLLESYTIEASVTCQLDDAMQAAKRALVLREQQGDPTGVGHNLRWISWLAWLAGRREEMDQRLGAALEVLEDQPPGPDLAMACADLAVRIGLYGGRREDAERIAQRAVALARDSGDPAVVCHVETQIGILPAALRGDDTQLRRGLALAIEGGRHMEAGVAYQALSGMAMLSRARTVAAKWITEGIAYLEVRQIEAPLRYLQGLHALHLFEGGEWDAAEAAAERLLGQPEACGITQIFALLTHARLQTRRGLLDEASATLQTLWTVAETCGLLQHIAPAAAALGEHAVLHGRAETAIGPLRSARTLAVALGAVPLVAELGFWLDRLGSLGSDEADNPPSSDPTEPYLLLQAGDWRAAAAIWEQLDFPYERARTLAEADDVDALATALEIADRLDAAPLAARVRARLRMLGVKAPRGPRNATRANPAGLTERQAEVLELLAEGMTDAEIAQRLVLSVRTVNRHVSSILDKLGVRSRRDAARRLAAMR